VRLTEHSDARLAHQLHSSWGDLVHELLKHGFDVKDGLTFCKTKTSFFFSHIFEKSNADVIAPLELDWFTIPTLYVYERHCIPSEGSCLRDPKVAGKLM
jgi:hypothetical protein